MNVTQGLRRALQINAGGIATTFGDRTRTWREIANRVARFAGVWQAMGIGRDDRVAVLMLNQDRYLELFLSTAWAGAVIVPVNIRWSAAEIEDSLRDCRPSALVVDDAFAALGGTIAQRIGTLRLIHADDGSPPAGAPSYEGLLEAAVAVPDAMRRADDLAGIFYTGGTTGRSKGVMLSHGNLMTNAVNLLAEGAFPHGSIYLHAPPMFHLANGAAMYAMLLSGGRNVLIRGFSPEPVMQAIAQHRVNELLLVPTMIQMLVDHPAIAAYDLSSVRRILFGASPMSEALLDRAMAALPQAQFVQAYGQTELSPVATLLHHREQIGEGRRLGRHRSGGRATFGVDIRIVDAAGNEVPRGSVGEICVRGDVVMQGYWERPEETAKALVDGWMHTGDGGTMDQDGFVYIVDRIKDMIVTGGENVYSAEVENAVAQFPAVAQCAVIGVPSERWGEAVHAVVVPRPGATVDPEALMAFCHERIAGYKCPRSVEVRETPMPMSGAGKILKRELRAPFWEGMERRVH
jgi:long-chain acyl-CoA synthetase